VKIKFATLISILFLSSAVLLSGEVVLANPSQSKAWNSYLQVNPFAGYTYANIYGQGTVPSYKGYGFGGEVAYLMGTTAFSIAPFISYRYLSLENTANNEDQTETLAGTQMNYGLFAISDSMYLKASLAQLNLRDTASGEIENTKDLKSSGFEVGAGLTLKFSSMVWSSLGLDIATFKFDPEDNPISERLDYLSCTLVFTLNIGIPSGPSKTGPQGK
jgi:hypothetical protein